MGLGKDLPGRLQQFRVRENPLGARQPRAQAGEIAVDRLAADHERRWFERPSPGDPDVQDGGRQLFCQGKRRRKARLHGPDTGTERHRSVDPCELALGRRYDEDHARERYSRIRIGCSGVSVQKQVPDDRLLGRFLAVMSATELTLHRLPDDRAVVLLAGEHDGYSAVRIAREIHTLLEEGRDVEIDLRNATFVDSTTTATLIEAHRYAAERGHRLTILIGESTGWPVRRLFELTQLDSLLTIVAER
jgi:anti-anti-sigma factor